MPDQKPSWWTDPRLQADRRAFERQFVTQELERMQREAFGNKATHDKFVGDKPQKR